ncbi:MAG: hypothetical protein QOF91_2959 [Alphaproteobacteria bacterium]|jgi:uncharacterized protein (DUF1330 family)|nr:hypothetical protein [Alphaproteobacteria bacterium]MEA3027674.1 hypothetical protein [Alphaproteobacteria bacterium]
MKMNLKLTFALLAGVALGALTIGGLNAQSKGPGAYAVVDIAEVTDPEGFKQLVPIAGPAAENAGGKYIARTEKITSLDGTPPKRFVIIAFDNVDKAKAWHASADQKKVDAIRSKTTKSRVFVVEGM